MILNDASGWRLDLARSVARAYGAEREICAVIAAGSVARGCAGAYSDAELVVFWARPPTGVERTDLIARVGATAPRLFPYNAEGELWQDLFFVGDLKFDVAHYTVDAVNRRLSDVVQRFDTAIIKQNLASVIHHAVNLHGDALVEAWQEKIAHFPDELARRAVRESIGLSPCGGREILAARDDLLLLYENVLIVERNLVTILLALNRIYHPGFKWLDRLCDELTIAPANLAPRLKRMLRAEPPGGINSLHELEPVRGGRSCPPECAGDAARPRRPL